MSKCLVFGIDCPHWDYDHCTTTKDNCWKQKVAEQNGLDIAIDVLNKQKPKKPVEDRGWLWCCPNCKSQLEYDEYINFCGYCGQAIDWREDE